MKDLGRAAIPAAERAAAGKKPAALAQAPAAAERAAADKKFPSGHPHQHACGATACKARIPKVLALCGKDDKHAVVVACNERVDKLACKQMCGERLRCGHPCTGSCDTCHGGSKPHYKACTVECNRTLLCNHACAGGHACSTECPPCQRPCAAWCSHRPTGCGKACGEPCVPCTAPCGRHCEHGACCAGCGHLDDHRSCSRKRTGLCAGPCAAVGDCSARCSLKLLCGHVCGGLCGEACPFLCGFCDPTGVALRLAALPGPAMAVGSAVLLVQLACRHVFGVQHLDAHLTAAENAAKDASGVLHPAPLPRCPECGTTVSGVQRYLPLMARMTAALDQSRLRAARKALEDDAARDLAAGAVQAAVQRLTAQLAARIGRGSTQLDPLLPTVHLLMGIAQLRAGKPLAAKASLGEAAMADGADASIKQRAALHTAVAILGGSDPASAAKDTALLCLASRQELQQALDVLQDCGNDAASLRRAVADEIAARVEIDRRTSAQAEEARRQAEARAAAHQAIAAAAARKAAADAQRARDVETARRQAADAAMAREVEKKGGTALHVAAICGRDIDVRALLESGEDASATDKMGDTPLHLAARGRHASTVRLLLETASWCTINKAGHSPVDDAITPPGPGRNISSFSDETARVVREALDAVTLADDPARRWAALRFKEGATCAALDELMALVGLRSVKEQALQLFTSVRLDMRRPEGSRSTHKQAMNFIFTGNPGTGKTTVARIFGSMLHQLGLREKDTFVETSGQKLLHEGAGKFKDKLAAATPGVLFVDEVYQLQPGKNADGAAITDAMMEVAENDRDKLTIIVAGYRDDVEQKWLQFNPGLSSRFREPVAFADYGEAELRAIFLGMVRTKYWRLHAEPAPAPHVAAGTNAGAASGGGGERKAMGIATIAARRLARGASRKGFANARSVRNLFELALRRADERIVADPTESSRSDPNFLVTLTKADVLGQPVDPDSHPLFRELKSMTGLEDVKRSVTSLARLAVDNFAREEAGEAVHDIALHRLFLGNPGTGKTSIAKVYGKLLKALGYLSNGDVIVVGASRLSGDVVGSAGTNTNKLLDSAAGKVLVIDEAYVLARSMYGKEALDTLVERVQGTPGEDFAVILCGYGDEMKEMIRTCNPGLARRFKMEEAFQFKDYDDAQLTAIMMQQARERGLGLSKDLANAAVANVLRKQRAKPNFGNAGAVKNLLDTAVTRMSARRSDAVDRGQPLPIADNNLVQADLFELQPEGAARAALAQLVNADHILEVVDGLEKQARVAKAQGKDGKALLTNWCFAGPPGTGKTTVARAFGEIFYGLNLLSSAEVVECKAMDLIGQYVGQSSPLMKAKMNEARGCVLFIDEAYGLNPATSPFAKESLEMLLANLTDPRYQGNMVVILAGYEDHMDRLLASNPGLPRRFPKRLEFKQWTAAACVQLVRKLCIDDGVEVPSQLQPALEAGFSDLIQRDAFGNAGDAKTVKDKICESRDMRCDEHGVVTGPVTAADVQSAFSALARQRKPLADAEARRLASIAQAAEARMAIAPPAYAVVPPGAPGAAPGSGGSSAMGQREREREAERAPEAIVKAVEEADPTLDVLFASLDQALRQLNYSLTRSRDIVARRDFPPELLALVAELAKSSPARVRPMLVAQCPTLLPRLEEAIRQQEEEAQRQREAEETIKRAKEEERAALRAAEEQERKKRMGAFICGVCGRWGCPVMPIWNEWDADAGPPKPYRPY